MSFLTRKYPFPEGDHQLRDSLVYAGIVFAILYLLQPFGFSMYQGNKLLVSMLFGVVTFGCCCVYGFVAKPLHARVVPWRIWHAVLSVLAMVLWIGVCNFFVFSWVFHYAITLGMFLQFVYWTLIVGVIITAFSVSMNYQRHLRSQLETLLNKTTDEQRDVVVTIRDTSVRGNDLQLPIIDLLFVEAQKNNVAVNYMQEGKLRTVELHTTLTAVLDDLQAYENIFQCHRSFVVNLNNITSAQGNSNGYQLRLGGCPTTVPVSRTYVPKLRSFIA